MKRILLTAVLLLTVGCSRPAEVEPSVDLTSYYTGTPQVFNTRQPGWKIGVLEPRDEGRDFSLNEYSTHEAVDRWIVVPIVIQNSSERRQKAEDFWNLFTSSGLVGSDNQLYNVTRYEYDDNQDLWEPVTANEARQVLLMFDVPEDVQPQQLLTHTTDTFNSLQIDF